MRDVTRQWAALLVALLSTLAFARGAAAQSPADLTELPAQARGLGADTAYAGGEVDSVNLFNGNLVLRLPLGLEYPVGPELSYRFVLYYNSKGWDSRSFTCADAGAFHTVDVPVADAADHRPQALHPDGDGRGRANAGFGWSLHFGRLFAPLQRRPGRWQYLAPDGGIHSFEERLHADRPVVPQADTAFTTDGTYLRLQHFTQGVSATYPCQDVTGSDPGQCAVVELPGGERQEFHDFGGTWDGEHVPDWRLTRRRDRFDNQMTVTYEADGLTWTVADSTGRSHSVEFAGPPGSYSRVEAVHLAAFGGAVATWDLEYLYGQQLERLGYLDSCSDTGPPGDPYGGVAVVDLLRAIRQPDGSFYEMDYYRTDDVQDVLPGGVRRLRLPTGGEIEWTYDSVGFLSGPPDPNGSEPFSQIEPVRTKTVLDPHAGAVPADCAQADAGVESGDTWEYAYLTEGAGIPDQPQGRSCHHQVTVTDPAGRTSVHYFATHDWEGWWYGLPYTVCPPADALPGLGHLSSRLFADDGSLLRSTYVEYESDEDPSTVYVNNRLRRQVEVFHDDGDRRRETVSSDFDGFGHWRTVTRYGFDGVERTATTLWNTAPGGGFKAFPLAAEPWLPETYPERRVSDGVGGLVVSRHCFDAVTGRRTRDRLLAGAATAGTDLVVARQATAAGFPSTVTWHGGDDGGVGDDGGDLCGASLGPVRYRLDLGYQAGVLAESASVDPASGDDVLRHFRAVIDAATGLAASNRDSAGVRTRFSYDLLGRATTIEPSEGALVELVYRLPGQLGVPLAEAPSVHSTASAGGEELTRRHLTFDGFGRLLEESESRPDGDAHRRFAYNPVGWQLGESTWAAAGAAPAGWSCRHDFDELGRPRRAVRPDGSETLFDFQGERLVASRVQVALESGDGWSHRTEIGDGLGRLVRLCEGDAAAWSGACGGVEAVYGYDAAERLTRVCLEPAGAACGQERGFDYDGRGFLVAEAPPELAGWSQRYRRDALGKAVETRLVPPSGSGAAEVLRLASTYDAAGRLVRVDEPAESGLRPLAEYFYHPMSVASGLGVGRAGGKLARRKRHNWISFKDQGWGSGYDPGAEVDVVVSEVFRYHGTDGALSHATTHFGLDHRVQGFRTRFDTDPLARWSAIAYPHCLYGVACPEGAVGRDVDRVYQGGFLTAVSSALGGAPAQPVASALAYHADGLLARVDHGNGRVQHMDEGADGMPRPRRVRVDGVWDSGDYAYDDAGNVSAIGADVYRYDRLGRLVRGELDGLVSSSQTASFDRFGNLTALATAGYAAQSFQVDGASNRLTGHGAQYDAAGNLTRLQIGAGATVLDYRWRWDSAGAVKEMEAESRRLFLYDAAGERVASIHCARRACKEEDRVLSITARDAEGRVLRAWDWDYAATPVWRRDYVHGDGALLATAEPAAGGGEALLHLHPDPLGSPRWITGDGGAVTSQHRYFPFGHEVLPAAVDGVALQFTGHERDPAYVDYMHARYYGLLAGRFLSLDPVSGEAAATQSWNRYAYALNRPLRFVDPDGLDEQERPATFWDRVDVVDDPDSVSAPPGLFRFLVQDLLSSSVGQLLDFGAGRLRRGGGSRDCGPIETFLRGVVDDLGPVTLSGEANFVPIAGLLGLGPAASVTIRPDGSIDAYVGGGFVLGAGGGRGSSAKLGGGLVTASTPGRPSGWGIRGAGGIPAVVPIGLVANGFLGPESSASVGVGAVVLPSGSLTFGRAFSLADPHVKPCR